MKAEPQPHLGYWKVKDGHETAVPDPCAKSGVQNSACRPGVQSLVCKRPMPTCKTQRAKLVCKNPVCKSQHAKPLCKTLRAEPGRTQHARPNVQKQACKAQPWAAIAAAPVRPIFAALRNALPPLRGRAPHRSALIQTHFGESFPTSLAKLGFGTGDDNKPPNTEECSKANLGFLLDPYRRYELFALQILIRITADT